MIPVFLELLLTDVFSIYTILLDIETGEKCCTKIFLMIIWNLYQSVPVFLVILLGSRTTEMAQKMAPIIGKLINSCDDHKILQRVNYSASFSKFYSSFHFFHFPVEALFNTIAKSQTSYQLWIV